MKKITIYTKPTCPFCIKAKALLDEKGAKYEEINIAVDDKSIKDKMIERANGKTTVPQIFIDDKHIGGCDDLHALDDKGKLDELLK